MGKMVISNLRWQLFQIGKMWQNDIFQAEETYKKWLPNTTTTCPWQNIFWEGIRILRNTVLTRIVLVKFVFIRNLIFNSQKNMASLPRAWLLQIFRQTQFVNSPLPPRKNWQQWALFVSVWEAVAKAVHEELAYLSPAHWWWLWGSLIWIEKHPGNF